MNYKVSQHTLLFTAGTVWTIAGANILHIGISCWNGDNHSWMIKAGGATLVFFLFFGFIFQKLYKKHTKRISKKQGKHCPRFPLGEHAQGEGAVLTQRLGSRRLEGKVLLPYRSRFIVGEKDAGLEHADVRNFSRPGESFPL